MIHTSGGQTRMNPRLSTDHAEGQHSAILERGNGIAP